MARDICSEEAETVLLNTLKPWLRQVVRPLEGRVRTGHGEPIVP